MLCLFLRISEVWMNSWTLSIPTYHTIHNLGFLRALQIEPFPLHDSVILSYLLFSISNIKVILQMCIYKYSSHHYNSFCIFLCWKSHGIKQHYKTHHSPDNARLKRLGAFKLPYLRIETFCELVTSTAAKIPNGQTAMRKKS